MCEVVQFFFVCVGWGGILLYVVSNSQNLILYVLVFGAHTDYRYVWLFLVQNIQIQKVFRAGYHLFVIGRYIQF